MTIVKPWQKSSPQDETTDAFSESYHKQAKVLFLDEPTSGLDPSTSQTIHSLIEELKQQGTTIFLTTHDMHEATILCDKIVLLNKGKIVEEGKPAELIQK